MTVILFSAENQLWDTYSELLLDACQAEGIEADITRDAERSEAEFIVYAPNDQLTDFTPYTNCKAVLSLWAGVERIVGNETLTQPLCRLVDPGLTQGMVEWVTGQVLRHHLGLDMYIHGTKGAWKQVVPPLAADRPVTILGAGALGAACAQSLTYLGFPVTCWSRTPKNLDGIKTIAGMANLNSALENAHILVLLLPLTDKTTNLLNDERLAHLPTGAFIINPGRGPLIDDQSLLAMLDTGHVEHATLDVFRVEPLPAEHPYWTHPSVTVTPHIASATRPETAVKSIAANMRRALNGEPLLNLVDRSRGY
ncbi:2-hydroxyacid dehydrogenase [Marivivens aquimaris]|uniref:2-hydroxyacid dehydrogenase n=1 Tax=Marivivens aquimaris TaxID=2774876 RepID=UPI00187E4808|nr:glyoxylate/hydroxypyruvate reductase A [Marivivens aquimaris]